MRSRHVILFAALALPHLLVGCGKRDFHAEFESIRNRVNHGEYAQALPELEAFEADHPEHVDASRAGLFRGKAHMALGEFGAARLAFQETIDRYPGSLEDHKSRYKLAVISLVEGKLDDAEQRFAVLADDPQGPLAAEATMMRTHVKSLIAAKLPAEAE